MPATRRSKSQVFPHWACTATSPQVFASVRPAQILNYSPNETTRRNGLVMGDTMRLIDCNGPRPLPPLDCARLRTQLGSAPSARSELCPQAGKGAGWVVGYCGMAFFLRILGNMAGIWISALVVPSIVFLPEEFLGETLLTLALVALVLTFVNSLIRPVIQFLAFPLYILTFGLFSLVTNAAVFSAAGWLSGVFSLPFSVHSFWGAVAGGTITALVSSLVVSVLGPPSTRSR